MAPISIHQNSHLKSHHRTEKGYRIHPTTRKSSHINSACSYCIMALNWYQMYRRVYFCPVLPIIRLENCPEVPIPLPPE